MPSLFDWGIRSARHVNETRKEKHITLIIIHFSYAAASHLTLEDFYGFL